MQKIKSIISIVLVCLMMLVNFPETIFAQQNHLDLLHSHEALCDDVNNDCDEHGHESLCNSGHEDCDSNCDESLCDSDHEECDDSICGCDLNAVKIAVFDSGIDEVETSGSVSFVEDTEILSTHGNTIARNLKSMIPNAKLYDVRILNNNNEGTYSSFAKGIDWAVENGMDIISLSAIGFEASSIIEEALKKAEDNNILVIAAAGNESNDIPLYPAAYSTVISVGAVNEDDQIEKYSNYGEYVDTYAIPLSEGTSFSTQSIVAKAAKIIESDPSISVKEIRKQITNGKIKNEIKESSAVDGVLYAAATCIHSFNGTYIIVKGPTCTAQGKKEGKCNKCGAVISTVAIPALGHSYGSWTTTKAATCTAAGSRKRTCTRCSVSQTETIAATGHTFNGSFTIVKNATCTAAGTKEGRCNKCNAVVTTVAIPALGHNYGSWTTTKAATCTAAGSRKRTCTRCSVSQTETIAATGHTFNGSFTVVKNATCTEEGIKEGRCNNCSAVVSTVSIPKIDHNYGSWVEVQAATCTTNGGKIGTCSRCNGKISQSIPATGHIFNGSFIIEKEPTCTDEGTKVGKCNNCGAVVTRVSIPPLGGTHSFNGSFTIVKNATCTEEGIKEGRCNNCSAVVSTVSIPKIDHDYGSWVVVQEATCVTNGGKIGTCSRCNGKISQSIPATGHSFNGSFIIEKEPTCTDEGTKVGKCNNCSAVVTRVSIPPLGGTHSFNGSFTIVKNATCTEEGIKEGRCNKCNAVVSTVTIPKIDHDYSWTVVQEETCTTNGGKIGTCSRCNGKISQSIPATGHKFNGSFVVEKEPTCTDEGTKVGKCDNCGIVLTRTSIPSLGRAGHSFNGSFTITKKPTCTDKGSKEGKCDVCGAIVATVDIPPLGGNHVFNGSFTIIKEATCTQDGRKEGRCTRCNSVITSISIPAGHSIIKSTLKTSPGNETIYGFDMEGSTIKVNATCSRCGNVDLTNKVAFTSSNENIAKVSNGKLVSGSRAGSAVITANYGTYRATCNVVVKSPWEAKFRYLTITPRSETITEFNKRGSKPKVTAVYDSGTQDVTSHVTFTSSNSNIAYIDNEGYIKSGAITQGTATITATYEGMTVACSVTVDMNGEPEKKPISLGKTTGLKIPDNLPVIGGTELKLGFDFIPATVQFGKEEFKIAVGIEDEKLLSEKWNDFKKTYEEAKKRVEKAKSFLKTHGGKKSGFSILKGWEPGAEIFGYIEGVMINGVPTVTKGSITCMLEANYTNQSQYFIGPIPVYLEIGGGIKLESICEISHYSKSSSQIQTRSEFKIKPRFEIGGGVGIANVVTVGGTGEAELEYLFHTYEDYRKITLTGSLNLKAKALIFEAEKTIAKGVWVLYESNKSQTQNYMALPPDDEEKFNIYNNGEYSLMKRDYLNRSSEWYGDKSQYMSGIYSAPDFTNKDTKVLGTNVFPDAQPQLVNYGDGHILVWITDNPDRDSANRTMLVYSIYDKESNSWSEPVPIDDDGTADFYPKLASDGSNIYVVWQNSNTIFNENITLEQVAKAGEIAVSKFDVESNAFTKPVIVTQNDLLDTLPQVVVDGDKTYITWISNNQNDIFGTKGKNSIYYSELEGDSWASPKLLCEGLNAVPSINAGFMNGSFTVAYVVDGDNNLETINDREVYAVQPGSASKRLTNNNILDSAPVFSVFNGRDALYWYSAGNICYVNGLDESPNIVFEDQQLGLSDEFQVLSGTQDELAIIWPNTSEGVTEIYSSIYNKDSGVWSDAVKISNTGSRLLSPSGVFDKDGNFKIAFNKITQLTNGSEQVDLCVTKITPAYNLTIDSVDVDHSKVIPGTKLEVNADVTNNGEIAVDEVIVEIIENGEAINSESVKVSINPGETKNVTVLMDLPETITKKTYSIRVTASEDEYNLSDNTKEFVIGYSDLSIEVDRYSENGIEYVTANIMNLSPVPSGAVLKVTKGSEDGEVIDTKVIKNVEGIISYKYKFEKNELCAGKDTEVLYFTVTADEEELYVSDNSKSIVINNEKAKISGYVGVNFNYSPDVEEQILSGFTVKVEGTDISTKTDANGYFEISDIPEDMKECTLEISKSGYLKRYVKVAGVGTGNTAVSSEDAPTVLWAGDAQIDGVQDGAINLEDLMQLAKAFNTESSDEQYVTDLDFNKDGVINMIDIFILIKNYNTASSSY